MPNLGLSRLSAKTISFGFIFIFSIFTFYLLSFKALTEDIPFLDGATEYEIFHERSFIYEEKSIVYAIILAPSDLSFEQRAQTTLKAVFDIRNETNVDIIQVHLRFPELKGKGKSVAYATFSVYGKNPNNNRTLKHDQWQVSAYDVQFTTKTLKVAGMWWSHIPGFKKASGPGGKMLDTEKLNEFVAKKLNIKIEEVILIVTEFDQSFQNPRDWP